MRRLEFHDPSSPASAGKFWEIDVNGATFTVRFGRLGTAGQSKPKSFATPAEAVQAADKLLAEKLAKGYREIKAAPTPMDASELFSALDRIEAWLQHHGTSLRLAPPATSKSIALAERTLGFALPPDYRAFLLRHDGQLKEEASWLPCGGRFHAIASATTEWTYQQKFIEPSNPIGYDDVFHGVVVHPLRLPIGGNDHWDGDDLVLDMFPGPKGHAGQILGFTTECDQILLGDSLTGFLTRYAALIENDALVCVPAVDQEYAFEVRPADWMKRNHYQTRWDKLFDPTSPVKKKKIPGAR